MTVEHHLVEALAHLDAAVDLGVSPLRQASITDARRAVELVLADVLREGSATKNRPPRCGSCNGTGLNTFSAVNSPCDDCSGEGVRRVAP